MISLHRPLLGFYKTEGSKHLSIFHYLNHISTANDPLYSSQSQIISTPLDSIQYPVENILTRLSKCCNLTELNQIHARIIRTHKLELYPVSVNWNNLIRAYTRLEAPRKAIWLYIAMLRARVLPDSYTLPIVLKAVCQILDVRIGRQLHSVAVRVGLESHEYCESGFISLYSKAAEFGNARKVFDQNTDRKLGSWNAIIGGLAQGGCAEEAIIMFMELRKCGFQPNEVTMVSVTSACGRLGDLNLALQLHKCVLQAKSYSKSDTLMLNSLIDMYGKCGQMDLAYRVFWRMEEKNVSSWTSMIVGYAMHGYFNEALEFFNRMRESGVRPNSITFVGVLSACVHGGDVEKGKYYLEMMKNVYGLVPKLQHYGCMVDLLGRAGLFHEAREMVEGMPMKPNTVIWGSLMGACEKYGNVKMGKWVAKHMKELEPYNDGVYVVLSNIYASRGLWEEVEEVRGIMKQRRLAKMSGYSFTTTLD